MMDSRMRRVFVFAVLAVVALALSGGFGGVAAQDGNTTPGTEIWNESVTSTIDGLQFDDDTGELFVMNGDTVDVLNESGGVIRSFTSPGNGLARVNLDEDGSSLHIIDNNLNYYEVSAADGSTIRSNTSNTHSSIFANGENGLVNSDYVKLSSDAEIVWNVDVATGLDRGTYHDGSVWMYGGDTVYEMSPTSPKDPQNTTFSDVEIQNFSVSIKPSSIDVNDNGVYLRSFSDQTVAKYNKGGTKVWEATNIDSRTDEIAARFNRVYSGDPATAYNDSDGSTVFQKSAVSGGGSGVATNGTAGYYADGSTVRAYASGGTAEGITGNLLECPESVQGCSPGGPTPPNGGIGPDAVVRWKENGVTVAEQNTSAAGNFTVPTSNLTDGEVYDVELEVSGEVRRTFSTVFDQTRAENQGLTYTTFAKDPLFVAGSASPTGSEIVNDSNVSLEINVSDPDFPSDEVKVSFYDYETGDPSRDTLIAEDTLSGSDERQTASVVWQNRTAGQSHSWYAVAEDKYNYTDTDTSQVHSFRRNVSSLEVLDSTASPDGTNVSAGSVGLSVDVAGGDGNVSVEFVNRRNSATIGTDTVQNGSGTASVTWSGRTGGEFVWGVNAEDERGTQAFSGNFNFEVYGDIEVYDAETAERLTNRTTRFEVSRPGEVNIFNRTTGRLNLSKLDSLEGEQARVSIKAQGFYESRLRLSTRATSRDVYLERGPNYIPDPNNSEDDPEDEPKVENDPDALDIRFTLEDQSGLFPAENSTLRIKKAIAAENNTKQLVHEETFGELNRVDVVLQDGDRYALNVSNEEGLTRGQGEFTATVSETIPLTIGDVEWQIDSGASIRWFAEAVDTSPPGAESPQNYTGRINFAYQDLNGGTLEERTDRLQVRIFEQTDRDNVILNRTFSNVTNVSESVAVTGEDATKRWVVEWDAERGTEDLSGSRVVQAIEDFTPDVVSELPDNVLTFFSVAFITFVAGLFGGRRSSFGALSVVFAGGVVYWMGFFEISAALLILTALVAAFYRITQGGDEIVKSTGRVVSTVFGVAFAFPTLLINLGLPSWAVSLVIAPVYIVSGFTLVSFLRGTRL